jgi:hypothetical protein
MVDVAGCFKMILNRASSCLRRQFAPGGMHPLHEIACELASSNTVLHW